MLHIPVTGAAFRLVQKFWEGIKSKGDAQQAIASKLEELERALHTPSLIGMDVATYEKSDPRARAAIGVLTGFPGFHPLLHTAKLQDVLTAITRLEHDFTTFVSLAMPLDQNLRIWLRSLINPGHEREEWPALMPQWIVGRTLGMGAEDLVPKQLPTQRQPVVLLLEQWHADFNRLMGGALNQFRGARANLGVSEEKLVVELQRLKTPR